MLAIHSYIHYDLRMPRPLLYNFHSFDLPEGVPELLALLNFFALWDRKEKTWRVMEMVGHERMRWKAMEFGGGSTSDWQKFLSSITTSEHLR